MKTLTLFLSLCAAVALADLVAPAESGCRDKKKGDSCKLDFSAGVCAESTCSRNDYSGGMPPRRKSVPCLTCVAAPEDAGSVSAPDAGVAPKGKQVKP